MTLGIPKPEKVVKPRTGFIKRSAEPRKRNPKRRKSEFSRAYGSDSRVSWIRGLPCVVCGSAPCENAHIETGGMGRKADAEKIIPLCETHHGALHSLGRLTFEDLFHRELDYLSLAQLAARIEARWQLHQTTSED